MKQANSSQSTHLHNDILLAKQGDEDAFERLLADYTPLIISSVGGCISEFLLAESDYEDLYQEAVILFFRAINRYDTEQDGVAFGLFAKICIRNGLSTQAKKLQKRIRIVESNAPDCDEPSPDEHVIEEERCKILYENVRNTLSAYENRIWWLYLSGQTAKNIALVLDTDEKSVQNAIYRIRRKLRAIIPHP
jgi:RNA polymerase sporulation-specific sigma factor